MVLPASTVRSLEGELRRRERVRELVLERARTIGRQSRDAIYEMHRGRDSRAKLRALTGLVRGLGPVRRTDPDLMQAGGMETALQEFAEAHLLAAVLAGRPLPTHRTLGISATPFLLGLADLIGEVRRAFQDRLKSGDLTAAGAHLRTMDDLFTIVMRFDQPDALLPIRRKQDVARGLLERSRSEFGIAHRGIELEHRIKQLEARLAHPLRRARRRRRR